jgi:hypothetical protein
MCKFTIRGELNEPFFAIIVNQSAELLKLMCKMNLKFLIVNNF